MITRVRNGHTNWGFGALILELLVVVVGIVIAFQIDRWAEYKRDREQERDYLFRLRDDLRLESQSMTSALRYAESRIADVLLLEKVIAEPALVRDRSTDVAESLEKATWRSWPQIDAFVYTELQSSGNLALIRSASLRRELANHYTIIRSQARVGLEFNIQHDFARLTAGILTSPDLQDIEGESRDGEAFQISPDRRIAIVGELSVRQEAIRLPPESHSIIYSTRKS